MGNDKRTNKAGNPQTPDDLLNPLPGVTGERAEKTVISPTGGKTGGFMSDPGDGTLADQPAERARALNDPYDDQRRGAGMEQSRDRSSVPPGERGHAGTNTDIAGEIEHGQGPYTSGSGAPHVGGMGTGTGRGRGSEIAGGVAGGGDSAGTGGLGGGFDSQLGTGAADGGLGSDLGGGLTGGTGGQGLPRRGDIAGTGGGVAVSAGRGSDTGTVGGGMAPDLSPATSGGMSGGTMGGSRESDLGSGLSGGMRSGMGNDVSGGIGGSDDEAAERDQQRSPRRREKH